MYLENMFGRVLLVLALASCAFVSDASADPTNSRPVVTSNGALQTLLDDHTVGGPGVSVADDQESTALFASEASGGAIATFVINLSNASAVNQFGIYSAGDASNKAMIFDGAPLAFPQAFVSFFANGNIYVNGALAAVGFGSQFGFYVDVFDADADAGTLDHTVYTEDSLNGVSPTAGALVYKGDGQTHLQLPPFSSGVFGTNEYLLAFDTSLTGANAGDFSDLVVLVESIRPVPVPGAAMLGVMGFGLVGLCRRRLN